MTILNDLGVTICYIGNVSLGSQLVFKDNCAVCNIGKKSSVNLFLQFMSLAVNGEKTVGELVF